MARDHARIRLDIWEDDDWRDLTHDGQWLYMFLLSSPALSFAGVGDWRPARISGAARGLSAARVEEFAVELEVEQFILVDRDTEEVLIRSWVKHDGLMKSPNMAVAFAKAHAAVASRVLRAVIVDQLHLLREAQPDLKGWAHEAAQRVLGKRSMPFVEGFAALPHNPSLIPSRTPSDIPSSMPSGKGSGNPFGNPSSTPSATPNSLLLTPNSSSSPLPSSHQSAPEAGS
ncbi:hypothetical protein [Oerskovia turbata]